MPEVITFGEAMIRLAPPDFQRLEQTRTMNVRVGGAELNTAVALARLGLNSAWVSRLTDNSLGRLLVNQAREAGVHTDFCLWTADDRVGLYFVEEGAAPRPASVLYDRRDSAMARIMPGMLDWPGIFQGARWFHITGITPALGLGPAEATREALEIARKFGLTISFDLNYRSKLWSLEEASIRLGQLLTACDHLITTREDAAGVFDIHGADHAEVAARIAERFRLRSVVLTQRDSPLAWRNSFTALLWHDGKIYQTTTYEVEIVDRLGAGDSFAAGFIYGFLTGNAQKALDWGVATAALKHTIPSDFAWLTGAEVEALLAGSDLRVRR